MTENKRKLILIDDDIEILELYPVVIRTFLPNYQLDIRTFTQGDEAFDYIRKNHIQIDLVFSDINHPGMNGISIAKNIKMLYPNIKIVLSSAILNKRTVLLGHKYADYFTPKPILLRDLCKQLGLLLQN